MQIDMTVEEAGLLIAALKQADDTFRGPIALALRDLRKWRSDLLLAYLRECASHVSSAGKQD